MEKDVLNFSDLVTYTGLSKSYLYKLTSQGILPRSKPFGQVFFDKKEIDTFLMSNHNTPPDLTASKAAAFVHLKNAGAR